MRKTTVGQAITQYFKTTTLHGFKYLCSAYTVDRVSWLVCCCASACCAGMLCAVLWARFLEVPALLTLWDNLSSNEFIEHRVPAIVVCPPTESVADMFLDKLSRNKTETARIPTTLARLLNGKSAAKDQLELLNDLLIANNTTLPEVMMNYTPSCKDHMKKCRYQEFIVPCEQLFEKELTNWGLCCVMRPKKLRKLSKTLVVHTTEILDLVIECSYGSRNYGCQLLPIYESEEYLDPDTLLSGYYYMAQLRFTAVPENPAAENLVTSTCVPDNGYTKTLCMLKCAEKACGCSDPLHFAMQHSTKILPMCPVTRMACLKNTEYKKNITCNCLPSCKKMTTYMVLESSPLNANNMHTIDPFYAEVNATSSIVVNLRVNLGHSRIFMLNPTETWLTLLSSLGGVFNMFLGVGLFSALEFIFLILFRLPITIKKSSEIDPTHNLMRTSTMYTSRPVVRY